MNTALSAAAAIILGFAAVFLALPQENGQNQSGPASTAVLAAELGIIPESLAIAGITSAAQVSAIMTNLHEAQTLREAYENAKNTLDSAGSTHTELTELVLIDAGNSTLVAQYEAANAALTSAKQAWSTARDDLIAAALDGASTESIASFHTWRASAHRSVPPQYRAVQRTDEQWKAIESALRAQQRATHMGTQLASSHAQVLSEINTDTDVITAANNLTTHLGSVESALQQTLTQ